MELRIFFVSLLSLAYTANAHNITTILADYKDLSTFNNYLTLTHLAAEINRRRTITVCAVDNAAMDDLLSKKFPLDTIKNILSLHVFADYFGSNKLHQLTKGTTTTSTLFQATGEAAGTSGYVNITDMKGGKVGFLPVDSGDDQPMATFVKSIHETPYTISVIQISNVLTSPEAESPAGSPAELNVISLMARQGCKAFSDLIIAQGTEKTFAESVASGLTVFCPTDDTVKAFLPRYRNLTADGKNSLLLYHAIPIYHSLGMLRSNNGMTNTLATEGAKKYDFTVQNDGDDVKLDTTVVTAKIKGTLIDAEPLAVFKIDKILLPMELFKVAPKSAKSSSGGDDGDVVAADEAPSNDGGKRGGGAIAGLVFRILVGILLTYSYF